LPLKLCHSILSFVKVSARGTSSETIDSNQSKSSPVW
jgi:hypothetical protein